MKNPNISKVLKAYRKLNNYSVNDLVIKLEDQNLPVAPKTVYGWESGQTQPDADTLLILCKIYHIDNILGTFGYSSSADDLSLSGEERNLVLEYRNHPAMQNAVKKLLDMQ
ncbi:MAG: helix-turn-helix transcriptional regulator [Lachnospiraceae bacterium]|nr:helix-turn-helix transcriptional regulator [Lachnospiraceae bacterium]